MNIRIKISMALLAMLFLIFMLGISSHYNSSSIISNIQEVNRAYQLANLAVRAEEEFLGVALNARRYVGDSKPQYRDALAEKLANVMIFEQALLSKASPEYHDRINELIANTKEYQHGVFDIVIPLHDKAMATADPAAAAELRSQEAESIYHYTNVAQNLIDSMRSIALEHESIVSASLAKAEAEARQVSQLALLLSLAAVLIGALLGLLLTRMVTVPVREMTQRLNIMAQGVFSGQTASPTLGRNDEFGLMAKSLQRVDANTRSLLERLSTNEALLRESERKYRELFEQSLDGIIAVSSEGRITHSNSAFLAMTGYSAQELETISVAKLAIGETPLGPRAAGNVDSQKLHRVELLTKEGRIRSVEISTFPQFGPTGSQAGIWAIIRDMSKRQETEYVLRDIVSAVAFSTGTAFFDSLIRYFVDGFGVKQALIGTVTESAIPEIRTLVNYCNGRLEPNFAYPVAGTPCEKIADTGQTCLYNGNVAEMFPADQALVDGNFRSYLGIALRDSTDTFIGNIVLLNDRPFESPEILISILQIYAARAATELERQRHESRVNYLAYHDASTTLPNRWKFNEHLDNLIADAGTESLAICILDLDDFGLINNFAGHAAGNAFIAAIANRFEMVLLQTCPGCLLARIGDDKFGFIIADPSARQIAGDLTERLIQAANIPWKYSDREIFTGASIGISVYPGDGNTREALIIHAEHALNQVKEHGKNNYRFYDPSFEVDLLRKVELQNEIYQALEKEEFCLYYQPQYDYTGTMLKGVEALIRWNHPSRGLILLAEFISVAETSGLIVPLGEWVIRTACRQIRAWVEQGCRPVRVSVNISAVQFDQADFVDTIRRALSEYNLAPTVLELEITESIALTDAIKANHKLTELAQLGVALSIDDFGTGYSSFSYLQKFPIQKLKMDRSFIRDLGVRAGSEAIVSAMIALAHNLNLKVVAEGVETQEQLDYLASRSCDYLQGFLLGRPAPPQDIARLLK